jgi:hypothetical protein
MMYNNSRKRGDEMDKKKNPWTRSELIELITLLVAILALIQGFNK